MKSISMKPLWNLLATELIGICTMVPKLGTTSIDLANSANRGTKQRQQTEATDGESGWMGSEQHPLPAAGGPAVAGRDAATSDAGPGRREGRRRRRAESAVVDGRAAGGEAEVAGNGEDGSGAWERGHRREWGTRRLRRGDPQRASEWALDWSGAKPSDWSRAGLLRGCRAEEESKQRRTLGCEPGMGGDHRAGVRTEASVREGRTPFFSLAPCGLVQLVHSTSTG